MSAGAGLWLRMEITGAQCPKRGTGPGQLVRERAYFLWENDGCPDGRANWQKAHDEHLQGRAYILWQQEGSPEGQADEQWH
jgi:hypothetical protein